MGYPSTPISARKMLDSSPTLQQSLELERQMDSLPPDRWPWRLAIWKIPRADFRSSMSSMISVQPCDHVQHCTTSFVIDRIIDHPMHVAAKIASNMKALWLREIPTNNRSAHVRKCLEKHWPLRIPLARPEVLVDLIHTANHWNRSYHINAMTAWKDDVFRPRL